MKTKTLSPKLSKRLNDEWLLDDIETEYVWDLINPFNPILLWKWENSPDVCREMYKTLTESEAIEFLPPFSFTKTDCEDITKYQIIYNGETFFWENLLEWLENLTTYLLDNNLLTK